MMNNIPFSLYQVFLILREHSESNYLVGGCVRDTFLNLSINDYDIVTDIDYEKMKDLFSNSGWKVNETGKDFLVMKISKYLPVLKVEHFKYGTLSYYVDEYVEYEIANFRTDGESFSDGRRPDKVDIGDIHTDSLRRDFTVNSLYMDIFTGNIIDPTKKGIQDITTKTLRFVGNPKQRIEEDYLRVFRFYRFLNKGFNPEKKSIKSVRELFDVAYKKTTPERVRLELEKLNK